MCQICMSYQYKSDATVLDVLPGRQTMEKISLTSINLYFAEDLKPKLFARDHKPSLHNYHKKKIVS